MKRRFIAIALLGLLGACNPAQQAQVNTIITEAQQDAVAVCGFLPTVETVASILSAGNPLLALPADIANAVCAAVKPPTSKPGVARSSAGPAVAGVVVNGKFVR